MVGLRFGQLQQLGAVLLEILQGIAHGLYHGPWGDGSADELVELTAVLAHCPTIIRRYAEALAIEAEDAIALGDFELVAQPRRLPMIHNPYASQLAVGADAHQQINVAAVTVHGDRRQDHSADAAILPGAPGGGWRWQAQQAAVGNLEAVLQQVVVVLF